MGKGKIVVLLSGGLDSTTTLYWALDKGYEAYALIFEYGQRHDKEVEKARAIAEKCGVDYEVIHLPFFWKGSALLDDKEDIPVRRNINDEVPATYVPARNLVFLSIAASFAEAIGAKKILIGANSVDYSGYPDCRPKFLRSMQETINLGTKEGDEGQGFVIEAPLVNLSKEEIIRLGIELGVPYEMTWSCYMGEDEPCGVCDSCVLREEGFRKWQKKRLG